MESDDSNELEYKKLDIELQKLKLERQRIAIDAKLKRKDQELQRKQFEANTRGWSKWNQILSPTGAAIFAGLVGLFGTVLNGCNNTNLERQKQQGTFILEAIKTGGTEEQKEQTTAANLVFLADAKLIDLSPPELEKLRKKADGRLPSLPPINASKERDVAVSSADVLFTLSESLKKTAEKDAATMKLKKIFAELEKDTAPLLSAVGISSTDIDGERMIRALIDIRRSLSMSDNHDMLNKVNQAIIANGQ